MSDTAEDPVELHGSLSATIITDVILVLICIGLHIWRERQHDPNYGTKTVNSLKLTRRGSVASSIDDLQPSISAHLSFNRSLSMCSSGKILVEIKDSIHRGALTWKDYGWLDLWKDIRVDMPLVIYVLTWYKILHSILYSYIDEETKRTKVERYLFSTIVPLDLNIVLAFILGTAVVQTLNKYLNKRNSIRSSLEAICGALQNMAMVIATMKVDDYGQKLFRRYAQLNAIHFLSFTASSRDERYDDILGLLRCGLVTEEEYKMLSKPFITKKNLAMLQKLYREVLDDMEKFQQEKDRRVFTEHCAKLRAMMGGAGLKLATCLYPPPAHECINRICAYSFLALLPVMCWEENNGHISNMVGLILCTLYVNLVLKLMSNADLLDYDPMDPAKRDTYAFNPDTYLLNTEVAIWTIMYSNEQHDKNLGSANSFAQMENALNIDERQAPSESEEEEVQKSESVDQVSEFDEEEEDSEEKTDLETEEKQTSDDQEEKEKSMLLEMEEEKRTPHSQEKKEKPILVQVEGGAAVRTAMELQPPDEFLAVGTPGTSV